MRGFFRVAGLLAWLAWEMGIDVREVAKQVGAQGVQNQSWHGVQLLAATAKWFVLDDRAAEVLEESVARTPRFHVDAGAWTQTHRALLEDMAAVSTTPDAHGQIGRRPLPGDLVILGENEDPRVRVVLEVRPGTNGPKVIFYDPGQDSGERAFLCSHVRTLPWFKSPSRAKVSA